LIVQPGGTSVAMRDAFGELVDVADSLVDVADSGEETGWASARSGRPGVHAVACSST
jgi:hypothetical protein